MYPILHDIDATSYRDNMGLGILADCISCNINIVRNDANSLTMQYPTNGNAADKIEGGKVIVINGFVDGGAPQPYYINKVSKPRRGVITVNAWHASYRLSGVMVKPFAYTTETDGIDGLLSAIHRNTVGGGRMTYVTDSLSGAVSYTLEKVTSLRAVLADIANKFNCVMTFQQSFDYTQYHDDWIQVNLWTQATYRDLPLYEGIDIDRAVFDYDGTNAYDGVFPYWKKNDVTIYSNAVIPSNLPAYARVIPLDLSSSFDTQPTQAQMTAAGQAYLAKGGGNPVTGWAITVNSNVQDINVGDVVDVALSDGTVITNVIESATFDVLAERYTKITLGNARKTLYKAISGIVRDYKSNTY